MPHIHILGTSHIAEESVKTIKKTFLEFKPDIVAVELDKERLHSLMQAEKDKAKGEKTQRKKLPPSAIKHIGFTGYLFALIGGFAQKKFGRMVGMDPGSDMLSAVKLAQNNKKMLLLLDQDLRITLKKLSRELKGREKRRMLGDLLFGWTKRRRQKINIDLKRVPEDKLITKLLEQTKDRYPSFYKVLVHDRNVFMARRLIAAGMQDPEAKILVVIGAGHKKGLEEELRKEHGKLIEHLKNKEQE